MKREKFFTALCALVLAFLLAWSALGCLISAFDLAVEAPEHLLGVCLITGVLSALLLSIPHGSILLVCLLALAGGYVYRDGRAADGLQPGLRLGRDAGSCRSCPGPGTGRSGGAHHRAGL